MEKEGERRDGREKAGKIDLTNLYVVLVLAGLCCFLWGSATPAIKTGYQLFQIDSKDTMSILLFAGVRFLLAGFLVILFNSVQAGSWIWPEKGSGWSVIKLSLAQTVGQYYFFYVGLASCIRCPWSDHHWNECVYCDFDGKSGLSLRDLD